MPWAIRAGPGPAWMVTTPIFYNAAHVAKTRVRLVCDPQGRPRRFIASLGTDATLCFMSRSLRPTRPEVRDVIRVTPVTPDTAGPTGEDNLDAALTSPLYVLADQLYPGRVTGRVMGDESTGAGTSGSRCSSTTSPKSNAFL